MDRRRFLQTMAAGTAVMNSLTAFAEPEHPATSESVMQGLVSAAETPVPGHTLLCSFAHHGQTWRVYEDLRTRDGVITFLSSAGHARVLPKYVEPVFPEEGPQRLGLDLKDIGMSGADLLADRLLVHGDPKEEEVRRAAPPMHSAPPPADPAYRPHWETFLGTSECSDTMPVFPAGNTRTYHPQQYFPELTQARARKRYEGLVGGWMPAVRKVLPAEEGAYYEVIVFGDVVAQDRFIVQTWHRTSHIENGRVVKVEYGYSYPAYSRRRQPPSQEEFYRGLLQFAEYWESRTHDMVPLTLPDTSWSNMARYAFVKEQIVRPGGTYPKYGSVDRDYYGPEYDGFQDIFTMSLYANLECGRFGLAREIFDGYFTSFVDAQGMINMRGPETGQFGLTLSLVARYYRYTGDRELLLKHRRKIEAMATLLAELHQEALGLPPDDRGHGLISGWCESDACLFPDPSVWWKPYFANSAMAIRGWRDLARTWTALDLPAADWRRRSDQLQQALIRSINANTQHDSKPAYIGPLPGTTMTFREAIAKEHPSEQGWSHRCYTELLQPDVIPHSQANMVINCMRAYGATTMGVVANVEPPNPEGREILGFISYGYAQMLLRLDRIEEYILFLYAHRYHDHSRGSWTAAEVSGVTGDGTLFCIPAQQTIPLLLRWMLVFEEEDESRLHLGRAVPRAWLASEKTISITGAPTRWGRVNYRVEWRAGSALVATVMLPSGTNLPKELHVRFRLPEGKHIAAFQVNGNQATPSDVAMEEIMIAPNGHTHFEIVAQLRS